MEQLYLSEQYCSFLLGSMRGAKSFAVPCAALSCLVRSIRVAHIGALQIYLKRNLRQLVVRGDHEGKAPLSKPRLRILIGTKTINGETSKAS